MTVESFVAMERVVVLNECVNEDVGNGLVVKRE